MEQNFECLQNVQFLVGDQDTVREITDMPAQRPFATQLLSFLEELSKVLRQEEDAKKYGDVMTFAFWIRKSSLLKMKETYQIAKPFVYGKGVLFHIAPSNVPVNFAYSLVTGLLAGNANIVRVSSKEFPQVTIITNAINQVLLSYPELKSYIVCLRYDRNREINDLFSSLADVRVIWGGDQTIAEIRKSPLPPRSGEVLFADRYSFAVIDSDYYLAQNDKEQVALDFYNDTFYSDQNACTSPRLVVWTGTQIEAAKALFWNHLHTLVKKKYQFQEIQGVNKLTSASLAAVREPDVKVRTQGDNFIYRIELNHVTADSIYPLENSGFFYEYHCQDLLELKEFCNDKRCQTCVYFGKKETLFPLLESGIKGIDRVVPMGKSMDFQLIWDGYSLIDSLTRRIEV